MSDKSKEAQEVLDALGTKFASSEKVDAVDKKVDGIQESMKEITGLLRANAPKETLTDPDTDSVQITRDELDDKNGKPKILMTKVLRGLIHQRVTGKWYPGKNAKEGREYALAEKYFHGGVTRAFEVLTDTAGGFIVPEEWDSAIIPTLKARSAVFGMGPNIITMRRDTMHLPAFDAKKTFVWSAENTAPTEGTPTTREIILTPKKVIGTAAVSTEWLEDADESANTDFRNELLGEMAEFIDLSFLEDQSGGPTALRNISGISTDGAAGDFVDGGTLTYDDMVRFENSLMSNDVRPPYAWIYHPRTLSEVAKIKSTDGVPLFVPNVNGTTATTPLGYPVFTSSQIPTNQVKGGSGAVMSYLLLVKPSDVVIGQRRGVTLDVSEHAQFEKDQIMIRMTARFDINVRHVESILHVDGIA